MLGRAAAIAVLVYGESNPRHLSRETKLADLLSLWLVFKLPPKKGFPRPLAFVIACAATGAMLGPAVIAVLAWTI